jgi:hypothetical protein
MSQNKDKNSAYGDVARRCEQPDLTEDDTNPGHNSGLDDGTDRSGVFTRTRSSIPAKPVHGAFGPPKRSTAVRTSFAQGK